MFSVKIRRAARGRQGQTMVLGTLGILLVSIMMMLTLNVGQAVHEKIRLQQVSDAAAFSMATQEARVFNFLAYTNRANIGSLVSASSMHSFMSMASVIPEMFQAASDTFWMHAGIEFAMCATCCWPYCFSMCKHCYHAIKDIDAALNYDDSAEDYRDAVKDLDSTFKNTIKLLDLHMLYITGAQKALVVEVGVQLLDDTITANLVTRYGTTTTTGNAYLLKVKNAGNLEILPSLISGDTRGFSDVFERDEETHKYVPTMISNATRYSDTMFGFTLNNWFVSDRGMFEAFAFMHPKALMQLLYKDGKPAKGFSIPITLKGQGRIIKGPSDPVGRVEGNSMGPDGDSAAAYDQGIILSMGFICIFSMIPMPSPYGGDSWNESWIASGPDGGDHENSDSCEDAKKHKFRCLDISKGPAACFTIFDAEPEAKYDYGQPSAYAVLMQDLSMMPNGGNNAPWKIDAQTDGKGTISIDLNMSGGGGPTEVAIANNQYKMGDFAKGVSMSKAMAYYHLPNYTGEGWKEHPNFFNPYWKAKLHPFRMLDAGVVLIAGHAAKYAVALPSAPLP
jgi:hypothetical protein